MAAVDYFLKIDGVDGESQADKHKGDIQLESWSWGVTNSGSAAEGGGGGSGKSVFQDFHFVMRVNKATPKLQLACATGEHLPKATLVCRKAGGEQQEFLKITLEDLIVSSYQTGGSGGSDVIPMDQISLNFAKINVEYREQNEKGAVGSPIKAGYNIKTAKKI
jgi:type VI secretion system secreted protein Hcp